MSRVLIVLALLLSGCGTGTQAILAPDPVPAESTQPAAPVSTVTTTAPAPGPQAQQPDPVVLVFGGDTSFTHGMADRDPFDGIQMVLSSADTAWVNLETAVAPDGVGAAPDKEYVFRSPPASVDLLASAGIDGVALANNHALDAGIAGLEETLRLLEEAGIESAGGGLDLGAATAPSMIEAGGLKVAMLSFSRVLPDTSWIATASRPGLASAYHPAVEEIPNLISEAAGAADIVVVMVHWGVELSVCPEPYQRDLARRWADAGADVIVGSHPHVLQGVERIGDAWVLYSTGNLVFPSASSPETTRSALFSIEVSAGSIDLQAVPLQLVDGRPMIAEDGSTVLEALTSRSFAVQFDGAGRAVSASAPSDCS